MLAVVVAAALQLGIGPTPAPTPAPSEVVLASPRVVVPLTYARKRITIQATINGAGPFTLLLNTNARLSLSPEALAAAHVAVLDQPMPTPGPVLTSASAVTPNPPPKIALVPEIAIAGVELKNVTAVANFRRGAVDGTIGYPLFARLRSRIDVRAATIVFTDPENDRTALAGTVIAMEIKRSQTPAVDGVVDGIAGVFLFDTATPSGLVLTSPFVNSHNLYTRATGSAAEENPGDTRFLAARPLNLNLGTLACGLVPTKLSTANAGIGSDPYSAGTLGMTILEKYIVTFDFPNGQVALEKYP